MEIEGRGAHVRVPQNIAGGFEIDATGEEPSCDGVPDQVEDGVLGLVEARVLEHSPYRPRNLGRSWASYFA